MANDQRPQADALQTDPKAPKPAPVNAVVLKVAASGLYLLLITLGSGGLAFSFWLVLRTDQLGVWAILASVLVAWWATYLIVRAPGYALRQRFARLGDLAGRSKQEIIQFAGPPTSVDPLIHGRERLQWEATGYHITLPFKEGICEGILQEVIN